MQQDQTTGQFSRPDILRPPSEWRSYYLPLTSGCSNNTCDFCGFYRRRLGLRDVDDVKKEIDALALYMSHHVRLPGIPEIVYYIADNWDGERVFLQDGDALVYPFTRMVEVLQYLRDKLPHVKRVAAYATPMDVLRRTPEELRTLKELNLGILYVGVESGDDDVLSSVHKGTTSAQMVEAARRVKEAGILLSVTAILGLAGVAGSQKHALATAQALSAMDPDFAGALTLTIVPGTPMYDRVSKGELEMVTPFQSLEELRTIVENASFTNCFFSSMHASNYFSIRGTLPRDKDRMLRQLDSVLQEKDPRLLRPEFLRGL